VPREVAFRMTSRTGRVDELYMRSDTALHEALRRQTEENSLELQEAERKRMKVVAQV
jgi:hypothetical protein